MFNATIDYIRLDNLTMEYILHSTTQATDRMSTTDGRIEAMSDNLESSVMFPNPSHFTLTFGFGVEFTRDGKDINPYYRAERLRLICYRALTLFNGYSIHEVRGGWIDPSGNSVIESGRTLVVNYEQMDDDTLAQFTQFIGRTLNQAVVVVTRGDRVAFVPIV